MSDKTLTIKLTGEQLRLIAYWRESCHLYNELCPLHCISPAGQDFCHSVVDAVKQQIKEQAQPQT